MRRSKILVCDDDDMIVQIITSKLRGEGFEVATVGSGRDVLRKLRASVPDLLIIDAVMPGIGGAEVLEAIRADTRLKRLPVMILSAKRDPEFIATVVRLGVSDYVAKPFALAELAKRVKKLVAAKPEDEYVLD